MRRLQTVLCIIGFSVAFGAVAPLTKTLAQAQSAGPVLAPAKYKPLPVGTIAYYKNLSYRVDKSNGLDITINFNDGRWAHYYGVFARSGEGVYGMYGRADGEWEATFGDSTRKAVEGFWPLKVGNKANFEVEEKTSSSYDGSLIYRTWRVSLEVTGTAYVTIDGLRYPTYVVKERLQGRGWFNGNDNTDFEIIWTRWYNPDSGIVIKMQKKLPDVIKLFRHKLAQIDYPEGVTNLALKGMPVSVGGATESDLAAAAERAKRETEKKYQAEIARIKQENQTAMRALQSAKQPTGNKPPGGTMDAVDFGTYHALVIGNQDYEHLPDLKTPVNDAKAVSKTLAKDYGFKVKTLINATRDDINDALDGYRDVLRDTDNLLIYYAGHGWLDEDTNRGYWLPVDARKNRRSRWISNATITDTLKGLLAKHVMVVADSCYSGTLIRGAAISVSANRYWRKMVHKRARVVLTSGGLEPVADKGGGGHSPFANAFIDALKDNEAVMDGTTLFGKMRRPVMVNSDQTPEYSDVRNAGHDGGDFLFVKKF